jgi:hypothetical protein
MNLVEGLASEDGLSIADLEMGGAKPVPLKTMISQDQLSEN